MKKISVLMFIVALFCGLSFFVGCAIKDDSSKYKISFDVDGSIIETVETDGKSEISLPKEPVKEGYVFDGWFFDKNIWNLELEKDTLVENRINQDVTVYAKWQSEGYKATFVADGSVVEVIKFGLNDGKIDNIPSVPNKTGYNGEWEKYTFEHKDITINAIYTPIEYKILYDNTKDVFNGNKTGYTIESETIILDVISKDGYDFLGWYKGKEKIEKIEKGSTGDIVLSAKWALISYTATFYADGLKIAETAFTIEDTILNSLPSIPEKKGYEGKWDNYKLGTADIRINAIYTPINYSIGYKDEFNAINENRTSYNIETETFDLLPLSKAGYVFGGWFDESNNKVEKIEKGTSGNKIFVAKWSVAEYTITYLNTKDAVNNNPRGYSSNSEDIILKGLSVEGYEFNGWFVSEYSKKRVV